MTQLNIIMKTDMANALRATWAAYNSLLVNVPSRDSTIHAAGFLAALEAVGLAVGVDWQDPPTPTYTRHPTTDSRQRRHFLTGDDHARMD